MASRLFLSMAGALAVFSSSIAVRAQQGIEAQPAVIDPAPPEQTAVAAPSLSRIVKEEIKVLRSGPLLVHGNYCGIGNRSNAVPADPLDLACMHHDACTRTGALPSCACDDRLRAEATAVAQDPATPADVQAIALATAASMAVLICR